MQNGYRFFNVERREYSDVRQLLIALLVLPFPLVVYGQSTITVYYNGTVVAHLYDVPAFKLFGLNITDLRVSGTQYNLTGNTLVFENGTAVTVVYDATFGQGVIEASEPFNATYYVMIPTTYAFVYISPPPSALVVTGNFYNLTLRGTSISVVYTEQSSVSPVNAVSSPYSRTLDFDKVDLVLLGALVASDAVLGLLLYKNVRAKRAQTEETKVAQTAPVSSEEEAELSSEELDDRDAIVLEAFKKGARTLSEAVKYTGLPKSTVYRRIKKLVKLGYLEERRERGSIWYVLTNKRGEKG